MNDLKCTPSESTYMTRHTKLFLALVNGRALEDEKAPTKVDDANENGIDNRIDNANEDNKNTNEFIMATPRKKRAARSG